MQLRTRSSALVAVALIGVILFIGAASAHSSVDSHAGVYEHPKRLDPPAFVVMKKAAVERMRQHKIEITDIVERNFDHEDYNPHRRDTNLTTSSTAITASYVPPMFLGAIRRVVSASYVLNESVSGDVDPGLHPTYFQSFYTETYAKNWFAKKSGVIAFATATHMDSACHVYNAPCTSITDFNVTQYTMTPLRIVNITDKVFGNPANPDYMMTVADVLAHEDIYGVLPDRAFLVMMSGWSNRIYNEALYYNRDAAGGKHFPGFSNDLIDWLIINRPWISGIGVDTSSVDAGANWSFHVHYAINAVVKVSVENLRLSNPTIPLAGAYITNTPVLFDGAPEALVKSTIYIP